MANSKKTTDYTRFWIFWIIMIVLTILLSCRTTKKTEDRMHTSQLTAGYEAQANLHVMDSLLRNMTFTFTGLEMWMSPASAPLPQGSDRPDTTRQAPQVHLKADKATASLSERQVTEASHSAGVRDTTARNVQEEQRTESSSKRDKGNPLVPALALVLAIYLVYHFRNEKS